MFNLFDFLQKAQLSQMDENDFYLAVSCGARERRLRSTLRLHELDEPWADGEFCIRRCFPIVNTSIFQTYITVFSYQTLLPQKLPRFSSPTTTIQTDCTMFVNNAFK
jgi:hypothetical protein